MTSNILMLDSITDAGSDAVGRVAVCGSHGGMLAAALASAAGLRAVVLNDAGIGLNGAGTRGVMALDQVGMAAAAVDCNTARIGSASDMAQNGDLSVVNETGKAIGLRVGQSVAAALSHLSLAPKPHSMLPPLKEARFDVTLAPGMPPVLCVDSASLIAPQDVGRIIVTGSHGGLIGNDPTRACKAKASFVAFNDAGEGKQRVGHGRLAPLDKFGIAAAVLDASSCEIGDARSSLENGRISGLNHRAEILGLRLGDRLRTAILAVFGS